MEETIRIVHVDDDPDFTTLSATVLEREDDRFDVEAAHSVRGGLDLIATGDVDCVVTDYEMPNRDGIDFLETIRDERDELPVIMFTGKGSETVASEAIAAGATDYLRKRAGGDQFTVLANRINNAVDRTRARREQRRQRIAIESAREGIAIVDDEGRFLFVNNAYSEIHATDEETLRGTHWERAYPDEAAATIRETALPQVHESARWTGELTGRRTDGETFTQDVVISTTGTGEHVFSVRDITAQQRRERRLANQKSKIEALHAVATDIEACDSEKAVYETVVEATESILEFDISIADGADGDRLVPQAVSSHLSAEQYYDTTAIDDQENLAAAAFRTGESSLVDDVRTHDAAPADSEFRSILTVPIGEYGIIQAVRKQPNAFDETDLELVELLIAHAHEQLARLESERAVRERTAELERQNERLNEFTAVVSHDLRNPLNVAEGRLELARTECESDHLSDVEAALDRMHTLVDDLLALAADGEETADVDRVELASLAETAWRTVDTRTASLEIETDHTVRADRSRLRQLFENLFRNAVEHGSTSRADPDGSADAVEHGSTSRASSPRQDAVEHGSTSHSEPDGSEDAVEHGDDDVTVTVGTIDAESSGDDQPIGDQSGDVDGFYVADDGPGIPAEVREQIFESGYSTAAGGTGFGLAIVDEIAAAHEWEVEVADADGGGARFDVTGISMGTE